ncbi:MAG: hypothetical protein COB26_00290 [Piscirickettsiaceae bacterium]|nr:MAG: hypothetical protein COB26_00290 [Piscirickettsiaceae bacterium]
MVTQTDVFNNIAKAPLFAGVSSSDLKSLLSGCVIHEYASGVEVIHLQRTYDGFYFIYNGAIKLYFLSKNGEEESAGSISSGNTFGEENIFMTDPLPVYGRTKQRTTLVYISRESMLTLLRQSPILSMQMMGLLSQRLYLMTRELESVCTLSAHERVMHYFLTEITNNMSVDSSLHLKETKAEVASSLHLTPETFSRVMHSLEDEGLISVDGKKIHIYDEQKLN